MCNIMFSVLLLRENHPPEILHKSDLGTKIKIRKIKHANIVQICCNLFFMKINQFHMLFIEIFPVDVEHIPLY